MSITKKKLSIEDLVVVAYLFAVVAADEGSALMKVMRVCLFGMTAILIVKRKKAVINSYVVWLLSFWAVSCCSIIWAKNSDFAVSMVKTLLFNALCVCSLMYLIRINPNRREIIYKCLAVFPLILEMRAIWAGGVFVFLNERSIGNISANTVGYCSAFGACFAFYSFFRSGKKWNLVLVLINLCILMLSGSRKAIVYFTLPIIFLYLYQDLSGKEKL